MTMTIEKSHKIYYFLFACLVILLIFFAFPAQGFAAGDLSLQVESVSAQPGEEVNVPIVINVNPGFASLKFAVNYNIANLSLTSVTFPKNTGTYSVVPEPYSGSQIINFVSPLTSFDKTGLFATLTFSVNENADIGTFETVALEFDEEDIFDMNFNNVPLDISTGNIMITDESTESMAKLPSFLVAVEDEAFMNTSFTYVELPETVTSIGSKAFANCGSLKYIYIPEGTTRIAKDAFLNDTNLIIIGKDGSYAQFFANSNGYVFQTR